MKHIEIKSPHVTPMDNSVRQRIDFASGLFQDDITVHTLIESFAEAFLVIDEEARVILTNQRFLDLFGYQKEEVVGQPLDIILPERFRKAHAIHVREYFKEPHVRPMGKGLELRGEKKSGEEFPVEVSISYLETQTVKMGLAFITDITARSQAEKSLQKQNKALSAFAQTVAHDLKSLITAITGFSDLLEEQFEDLSADDRQQALGMVKEAGYKMNDIVSELLLLAKLRREEVVLEPMDFNGAVSEALKRLQWKVDSSKADIVLAGNNTPIMGYQPWIEEVVYNLISNAISHGGSNLTVTVSAEPADEDKVRFRIVDNGNGMTDEQLRLLLEQPEDLPYNWVKGHGLGLTIVREILEKLGSALEVFCEENNGCTFSFLLPRQPE